MRPEGALLKFLKEVVKLELAEAERREKRLSKYVLPGSRFYKIYFPRLKYGEVHEDIVKVVWDEEKSHDKAEIITRCKYDRNTHYKYMMTRKEGNWLIKDYAYTCAVCLGKGCDRCKGWVDKVKYDAKGAEKNPAIVSGDSDGDLHGCVIFGAIFSSAMESMVYCVNSISRDYCRPSYWVKGE